MKKLLVGFWATLFFSLGLPKIADMFDTLIIEKAIESDRSIAANGRSCGSSSNETERAKTKLKS
jgi:hypothetical protein